MCQSFCAILVSMFVVGDDFRPATILYLYTHKRLLSACILDQNALSDGLRLLSSSAALAATVATRRPDAVIAFMALLLRGKLVVAEEVMALLLLKSRYLAPFFNDTLSLLQLITKVELSSTT